MYRILKLFILLLISTFSKTVLGQLQILPQSNAQLLAQKLVGSGVTIKNVSLKGSNLSTAFFYNQANTQLGIDSGIVLSTGRVLTSGNLYGLNGPQSLTASSQTNTAGDPQLSALVSPQPTNDAVILEFDFIPVGDSVKFRYVFSSDEYPTFTCSDFNDVFAFFISGPGITGTKNIALVPGTNIPVAINSINDGIPGGSYNIRNCNNMGAGSPFTKYFVNNTGNQFFTHDGHTVVLTASAAVQPCQTYHLKITIADVQDKSFDSGVFLEAESLKSELLRIIPYTPLVNGMPYLVEGCQQGGVKILRSQKTPYPQTVNIVFGGTAINGTDVQMVGAVAIIPADDSMVYIPITPVVDNLAEGIEVLKIYVSNGCIFSNLFLDSLQIQVRDYDTLAMAPWGTISLCSKSSLQVIANPGFSSYQWMPAVSMNNSTISNPVVTPSTTTTYICTATRGDCHAMDSVRIKLKTLDLVGKKDVDCVNGNTGMIRVGGGVAWKPPLQFSINNGIFGPDSVFKQLSAGSYMIRISDASGCVDSLNVDLVQAYPNLVISDSITPASCMGTNGAVQINASGGNAPYLFTVDAGNYTLNSKYAITNGTHHLSVKDASGCTASTQIIVGMDPPINFTTTISAASCGGSPDGTIYIHATGGSGQYMYAINGTNYQAPDSFHVSVGSVTVLVRDQKGCTATQIVTVPFYQSVLIDAGKDTSICEGSSIQMNATANASQFLWSPAKDLSNNFISNPVASPTVTTTYYVTASKDLCATTDSVTVFVRPAPIPDAGPDSSICTGRTLQLSGSGGTTYSWLPSSQVSNAFSASPTVRPIQTTAYYLQVFDDNHCASLFPDTVRITVVPAVHVFAGGDTSVAKGQSLVLSGNELSNSGATVYQWSPTVGLNNPFILNPVATLVNDITYTLKIITAEGCEGSDNVTVKVFNGPDIYVPSGFTPNGDGKNDVLRAIPVGMKELRYFKVFNRWGLLIFSTTSERNGWDGMSNNKLQPAGSYIYIAEGIDFRGRLMLRRGTTTLIR